MGLAIEPLFAVFVASLTLDQSHVEPRVLVDREGQYARHVDCPDRLVACDVVSDRVSFANEYTSARAGPAPFFPYRRSRPRPRASRTNHRSGTGTGLAAGILNAAHAVHHCRSTLLFA